MTDYEIISIVLMFLNIIVLIFLHKDQKNNRASTKIRGYFLTK